MSEYHILEVTFFIIIIFLRFGLRRNPNFIRRLSNLRIGRLEKSGNYEEIAKTYMRTAKFYRKKFFKENLLGLACLYRQDSGNAVEHFQNSLEGAVGVSISNIEGSLAIALLQNRWYREALELLEELKKEGNLPIVPYVLALLINDKDVEAKKFYSNNKIKDTEGTEIEKLLQFDVLKPEMIGSMKELVDNNRALWIYKPLLKDLVEKWEVDIFFNTPGRYETLEKQARELILKLDKQPALFNNANVKQMRSAISLVLPRISSYEGCSNLWGIADNYEEIALVLPIDEALKTECSTFWKRVYRIFFSTCDINSYDPDMEMVFIKEQLPSDAKNAVKWTTRCSLYLSEKNDYALRSALIDYDDFSIFNVDLIEKSMAEEIVSDINPLIEIMGEDPSTKKTLEPLLYSLVCNRGAITHSDLVDILNKIPASNHGRLENLYKRVNEQI